MTLKINEKQLKKVNKINPFPNLIINKKEIKIRLQDNSGISNDNYHSLFSFSYDHKSNNRFYNITKKNYFAKCSINNRILNAKIEKKYNNLLDRKNTENIKNKLLNKAASSTSDSLDNSFNKELKNNYFFKSFYKNKEQNDFLIIRQKTFDLSRIKSSKMYNKNKNNKTSIQTNYKTNSVKKKESSKKYQTIFSKYKIKETKDNEKPQELVQNFELLSSKYYINEFIDIENSKRLFTPRKKTINKEIPKMEFHNKTLNEKYYKTEASKNSKSNTSLLMAKYVQIPNIENLKNFKNRHKPIFFCQKDSVIKNINLMIKNNKTEKNFRAGAMTSKYLDKKTINILFNKISSKGKEKNSFFEMRYTPINLNGFAKIPNRLIRLDRYGNKLEQINDNIKNKKGDINHIYAFQKLKEHMLNKFSLIKKNIK